MLDKERILSKLDELDSYLGELKSIMPKSYAEYSKSVEKKRSCERLLHIAIEGFDKWAFGHSKPHQNLLESV